MTSTDNTDALMTVVDVAARLRVSDKTVYRWLRSGHLKGTRVGPWGVWRIRASEVERVTGGKSDGQQ